MYCDVDWEQWKISIRVLVKNGNSLVSWKSKKQNVVFRSSAEAKYSSMANAVAKVVWLTPLLKELHNEVSSPVIMYNDSRAALQITANSAFHERTKYIEIDCHFIRQKIQENLIKTYSLVGKDQLANLLTKGLPRPQHEYLVGRLGMLNIFIPTS